MLLITGGRDYSEALNGKIIKKNSTQKKKWVLRDEELCA